MATKNIKKTKVSKEGLVNQLMEHNISLQSKVTDLITSINELNKKLSGMVELFEEAAKHIKAGTDEPLMRKLETLLEQNKNIARGLILLEKYVREKASTPTFTPPKPLSETESL